MKRFDIRVDFSEDTYLDEFILKITDDNERNIIKMDTAEILELYNEVKHAVETNII